MNIFEHQSMEYEVAPKVVLSPSQISRYFSDPWAWYNEQVLGKQGFIGNEASMIGSICHYIYKEMSENNGDVDIGMMHDKISDDLFAYINEHHLEIDVHRVLDGYRDVCNEVLKYIRRDSDRPVFCECSRKMELSNGIWLSGTIDRWEPTTGRVCDYKTVSKKPNVDYIPLNYKLQLLSYVKLLLNAGEFPKTINIIYGVKPLKTIGARWFLVQEDVTQRDIDWINSIYDNVVRSIEICEKDASMIPIIFRRMWYESDKVC